MTENDIPSVLEIEQSAHTHPWTEGIIRNCFQSGYNFWLLEKENRLCGFAVVMIVAGEGTLMNLVIAPDFQKQGLGQALLEYAVEQTEQQQGNIMFLEVRESNLPAINLYEQNCFSEVGRRKGYYPTATGRETAIIMARDLSFPTES